MSIKGIKTSLMFFLIAVFPIQLFSQSEIIKSIILYKKDKKGIWIPDNKYEYFYDVNKYQEILSDWNGNSWINKEKRIRENNINSDSIIVSYYKMIDSTWSLDKMKIGILKKESSEKIYYEVRTESTDEKLRMRRKRFEKKRDKKVVSTYSAKKREFHTILKLLPNSYIRHIIEIGNSTKENEEKLKNYSPLRCGMSKQIEFEILYNKKEKVGQFKSEEIKGIIEYQNKN